MTREEAINELEALKQDYWDDDGYGHETKQYDDTMTALDMAIEALNQKWIPVTEKLPEEMGTYLVTLDYEKHGTGITTLWFYGSLGWDLCVADEVTAWMPLPQPYKAESEVEDGKID